MALSVSSISPYYGPIAGGTTITATGTFDSGDTFTMVIGGISCTSVTRVSATSLTGITGAISAGAQVNVVVTDVTLATSVTLIKGFAYLNPGQMCLGQMRDLAKDRADLVNSGFITDASWNSYINQSAYELYDLLITCYGEDYFIKNPPYQVTLDGSSQLYAFPVDFYKLTGVDLQLGNVQNSWITLRNFKFSDRNFYSLPNIVPNIVGLTNLRYRPNGNNLLLNMIPAAGQIIRMWYVPRLVELVLNTDILDGVHGWTEYIIVDAAIKAMQKEESDVGTLLLQKAALVKRVNDSAPNRDAGFPQIVGDVSGVSSDGSPWGYPGGDYGGY